MEGKIKKRRIKKISSIEIKMRKDYRVTACNYPAELGMSLGDEVCVVLAKPIVMPNRIHYFVNGILGKNAIGRTREEYFVDYILGGKKTHKLAPGDRLFDKDMGFIGYVTERAA